jgi:hypothetical protein
MKNKKTIYGAKFVAYVAFMSDSDNEITLNELAHRAFEFYEPNITIDCIKSLTPISRTAEPKMWRAIEDQIFNEQEYEPYSPGGSRKLSEIMREVEDRERLKQLENIFFGKERELAEYVLLKEKLKQ